MDEDRVILRVFVGTLFLVISFVGTVAMALNLIQHPNALTVIFGIPFNALFFLSGFLTLRTACKIIQSMDRKSRLRCLRRTVVIVVFLAAFTYVASYPLARKFETDATRIPGFQPVEWLIDFTPLQGPMLTWAESFGVRSEIAADVAMRRFERHSANGRRNKDSGRNSD